MAAFAQTSLGQEACLALQPPMSQRESEALLAQTRAVDALASEFAADLDFGGIQTKQAKEALQRSKRGGLLAGTALQAIASVLVGAGKLQRAIKVRPRLSSTSVCGPRVWRSGATPNPAHTHGLSLWCVWGYAHAAPALPLPGGKERHSGPRPTNSCMLWCAVCAMQAAAREAERTSYSAIEPVTAAFKASQRAPCPSVHVTVHDPCSRACMFSGFQKGSYKSFSHLIQLH